MNRMEQYARVCAHIDLDAVHHNLEAMRSHISKQTIGTIRCFVILQVYSSRYTKTR